MSYPPIVDADVDYKFCLEKIHKQLSCLFFLKYFQYGKMSSSAIQGIDVTEISVVIILICVELLPKI